MRHSDRLFYLSLSSAHVKLCHRVSYQFQHHDFFYCNVKAGDFIKNMRENTFQSWEGVVEGGLIRHKIMHMRKIMNFLTKCIQIASNLIKDKQVPSHVFEIKVTVEIRLKYSVCTPLTFYTLW